MTRAQALWTSWRTENRDALAIVLQRDPFAHWDRNRMPESLAERRLGDGVGLLVSDPDDPLGPEFLAQLLAVSSRALEDGRFPDHGSWPANRGRALRARAYATAFLGRPVSLEQLREASVSFEQYCKSERKRDWSEVSEAYLLAAVRLLLVAGDVAGARSALAIDRPFPHLEPERSALSAFTDGSADALRTLFEEVRLPSFAPSSFTETEVLRIELALLTRRDGWASQQVNWRAALETISA